MRKIITLPPSPATRAAKMKPAAYASRGLAPASSTARARSRLPCRKPEGSQSHSPRRAGQNTIFNIDIHGVESPVMIVDWQYEPFKSTLLHVDLKRIDLSKRVTVKVPVHTQGDPLGVKVQGGLHEMITREIEIECLPDDIPEVL